MRVVFPEELGPSVDRAIFIENNQRVRSEYNDINNIRHKVLEEMKICRSYFHQAYRPPAFDDIVAKSLASAQASFSQHCDVNFFNSLSIGRRHQLLAFFQSVHEGGRWVAVRPTDNLPVAFTQAWNALPLAARDKIAMEATSAALSACRRAVESWVPPERIVEKVVYRERDHSICTVM
eukprot:TRINITY_DN6148_c0_g1_i2.p1 TRINITY_DN6148_c0_g1~~TRINITY_DN6148_c0_g1_i2.p1  ORF type:complete len:178 (+),score=25.28 TRINITY_DN6148_c0_g1_i2:768-1301(+)